MSIMKKNQRSYLFNKLWEEEYFFIQKKEKCVCLICNSVVSVAKKHNLERHYNTNHPSFDVNYPLNSDLRKTKIDNLKSMLSNQQTFLKKAVNKNINATISSFKISHLLAKRKKAFIDSELIKEAFLTCADTLFEGFPNKREIISAIQDLQLSNDTTTRRIQVISFDLQSQLKSDLDKCEWFSLQLDESTDISNTAQLAVMIRMVFNDYTVKEELLKLLSMNERTRGEDIYNIFKQYATEINMPLHKVSAIITDGAPAMVGCNNGFISHCMKDDSFTNFMVYHCIIHQETLCAKILSFDHVMNIVVTIINQIRANPLSHRIFKALVETGELSKSHISLHTDIRWLSRGKALGQFFDLLEEIRTFLTSKGQTFEQLNNINWLLDLAFLTDICQKLNILNLELQGKDKHLAEMISSIKAFKAKLQFWINNFSKKSLLHFPRMNKVIGEKNFDQKIYISHLEKLLHQFDIRFKQFTSVEPVATFFVNPFSTQFDISEIAKSIGELLQEESVKIEEEILNFKNDVILKSYSTAEHFWNLVNDKKYTLLKKGAYKIKSCFGSTYLCESLFSTMNIIKSKNRSQLTNANLDDCLRLGLSSYIPNFEKLAEDMKCQRSH